KSYHWGIWISAILFSSLHLQFYGFIPRMLLGVAFGYLLVWSGSMWLPIAAHFLNNALAVLALYFIDKRMLSPKLEEYGATTESFYLAGISLLLIILFMYMIKKENRENKLDYAETEEPQ
ncbi:MAG: CPBP family intramembrane glutamic endopeptidase, partial [Prolixibacteraceae bacterium]